MRKIILISTILFCAAFSFAQQSGIQLRFNQEGYFKIAQFTDLHWSNNSHNVGSTAEVIKSVLVVEKPDLAVITGDIVTSSPGKEGWLALAKLFEEARMPWTVTFGNHDEEAGLSLDEIMALLEKQPYFVGENSPANVSGSGNHVLPILSRTGTKISALLYCFDTHNKPPAHKYGEYNWIQFDQIEWYRETSDRFTKNNNNVPLPALAFLHIPLPEYNNVGRKETTLGHNSGRTWSAEINSGLFSSMVEKKNVIGVFAGHSHDNDYIGTEHDIALAFGRITGVQAGGSLERGGRIIKLYEDKFRFDTWIRTPKGVEFEYVFPPSLSAAEEENMNYLPAINLNAKTLQQGVAYKYYEADFKLTHTNMIASARLVREGIQPNFSIASATAKDSMAFDFRTYINIPERGVYQFYTLSDDGSALFINGQLVVDNDGTHSLRRVNGKVALEAGFHELRVLYFENYMGEFLEVGMSSRSIREDVIPDYMLYVAK
jgi:hypothetical protein